ncbi:Penicillin-binding protein 2D [Corynebacterium kalinowskii]|uniref:Penicillin-binding protein 2D n=2 Tax=Corynebacterium kalinowskii TaxID=2675216 RepID=A0A6B8VVS0_9CORY|nr:Penicillin-binding protein 2D [Corynebacterium kalinowskii]
MKSLLTALGAIITAGVVSAAALTPAASLSSVAIARTNETMQSNLSDLTDGTAPGVSTITDANGAPIAWIYDQYRVDVPSEQIAPTMKKAIVAIEDRRFYEHDGVDWRGTARAMVTNLTSGSVEQGASTLNQQYVKNYLLLVDAESEAEQAAATETSYARKLREMRMASDLEKKLSKDEILTRYLNVVPYGNGAFGIEAAAQTYFGKHAAELSVTESALLAGIVQSSSALNPYTNPEGMTERRNQVLDALVSTGDLSAEEAGQLKAAPLGILDQPKRLPNGCIGAGDRGFFCDYALKYLEGNGLDPARLQREGLTVKTTLDPAVQDAAHNAVVAHTNPQAQGVAEVLNVVEPGKESRRILAMTSSRDYGLNVEKNETMLPQTASRVGNGAGSIFKIFTAGAAIEQGMGIETVLDVPKRVEVSGMGDGGAKNCPPGKYCVENAAAFKPQMTLKQALAQSPNTTFIKLIEQTGVKESVDMAVRLGLRDYTEAGSFDGKSSIAQYFGDNNLGSFVLGPTSVNPLQLSNVAATLASDGTWCEPSPIDSVTDRNGAPIKLKKTPCEQAVEPAIAHALADAMSDDTKNGTAAPAANNWGWSAPTAGKTGTTESHQSAAFMGFNSNFAAVPYIYNDGTETMSLCTGPVRQCYDGTLFGGMEPTSTWMSVASKTPGAAAGTVAKADPAQIKGKTQAIADQVVGKTSAAAKSQLEAQGYAVTVENVSGPSNKKGQVINVKLANLRDAKPAVTLLVSDGSQPVAPAPAPAPRQQSPAPVAPPPAAPAAPPASNLEDLLWDLLEQNGL